MDAEQDPVVARMHACIAGWEASGDGRAVFLGCCALMTGNMLAALDRQEFHDCAWVGRLLDHFAQYYFDALDAYDGAAQAAPRVWRCAYDAACRPASPVLQQLLLGINAHINYDLVLATADMLEDEWQSLSAEARELRRADYDHVNAIISDTVDAVQDSILERREPWLELIDRALGSVDEWMISRLIGEWRTEVWRRAVRRVELTDPAEREAQRQAVEEAALVWTRLFGG